MKKKILLCILLIITALSFSICAEDKKEGITHKVWIWQETGDCLWNLAKKYYGDGKKWRRIYNANKDQIEDPNVIYPKQILYIP
ncbi:MAG: hypothetical protein AUJ85_09230 [Elusimicrobia bacterium CG1_02_37_114]|nr:MAG: hypothetical protein AUJ85_09230 [Elusimicrobia bacterium CG1_02_37_114]PIV53955.1 MAG: hypothetical protein COS17_01230 [Elusimicrobia bacterium CG02_land_8_20_14_3_00_37_13]